jgi:hypothetical protein
MPDDVDDTAELIGTPLNMDLDPLDGVNAENDDQDADPTEPRRFDGGSDEPDTGFSSGH